MTFAWPQYLYLLAVPVVLLVMEILRRRRAGSDTRPKVARAQAGLSTVKLAGSRAHARATGRVRLFLVAGLALAVVAIARPQWGLLDEQVFDQSREIVVAVDLSRSMLAQDVKPSRLNRGKLLIQSMLEKLEGERVGLLLFAGTAFLQSPLSADYEILNEFLPSLSPATLPEGGTNYGALLDTAAQAFVGESAADRFLIVLSDGEATDTDWKDHLDGLAKKGVRVIGLGVGTAAGSVIPDGQGGLVKDSSGAVVMSKLENNTLQELTSSTGGVYRDASTWLDLNSLLQSTIESGRKGSFIEQSRVRRAERYQWFLAPAFFFLLISFAWEFPVRPRPRELKLTGTTATAALALLLLVGAREARALVADDPQPATENNPGLVPLTNTVTRLSQKPNRTAGDWSEMAQNTVTYGEHYVNQKEQVPESPVQDGLAAVDAGEKLDPRAADWARLRKTLQEMLRQQPPPEENPEEKQDQGMNGPQEKGDQQKGEDQKDDGQKGDDQNQDMDNPDGQKGDPNDQQDQKDMGNQNEEEAFGDMNASEGEITPNPNQNQQVGGSREAKQIEIDPSLTLPLQKLEQLKNQDSPARLFQLMEGTPKGGEKKNEKDW